MPRPSTNYKQLRARLITPVPQPRADAPAPALAPDPHAYPAHWVKGQLLNVRHNGSTYIVTPLEEEFDRDHPERAKFFDSSFEAQEFVSWWYARDSVDPRAV